MIPDFTILCACDASHVEELRLSYQTWAKYKPSLLRRPLIVGCDLDTCPVDPSGDWYRERLAPLMSHPGGIKLKFISEPTWPLRERMVSWFVFGVRFVETPYYLKLDADAIATAGPDDWIDPDWFADSPAIVAPKWGYTRPATQLFDFKDWSNQHPQAFPHRMPYFEIRGDKAHHRRMISYCQFGNTDWTWQMAELAGERLPIPSQDGYLSLCAARSGAKIRFADMKARGWKHVGSNLARLRKAAAEAMGAT